MPPADPASLRQVCEQLARGAGAIALEGRRSRIGRADLPGGTKSSTTDIATEFDQAAEEYVVAWLRSNRPADAIVGEEGTDQVGTSGFEWIIDPIDGTTNYVYDQPAWSNSIAVARDGEMIAGAVFVPPLDEMFSAALGDGATLNGAPIDVSDQTDLSLSLVGTGFGYQAETRRAQAAVVAEVIGQVRDIRRLGSAAFDLCMVACGRLDAYYERHLNAWDAAAGELIAREAGALTSDYSGGPARPAELIVSTPGVHEGLRSILQRL